MSTATQTPANPNASIWNTPVPTGGKGEDFTPVPVGNHVGRIAGLFDVGHHPTERTDDKTKEKRWVDTRQLVIAYELGKKQPNGRPFVIADKMTFSMHEKSNLFALVVNVTGQKFEPGTSFDPVAGLLGLPVMVNVVARPSKDGQKVYSNVSSVGQFPDGFQTPEFLCKAVAWSVLEGTPVPAEPWVADVYSYGRSIADLASTSNEGKGKVSHEAPAGRATTPRPPGPTAAPSKQLDYPDYVRVLMAKYSLPECYTHDDIPDQAAGADAAKLAEFSIPF